MANDPEVQAAQRVYEETIRELQYEAENNPAFVCPICGPAVPPSGSATEPSEAAIGDESDIGTRARIAADFGLKYDNKWYQGYSAGLRWAMQNVPAPSPDAGGREASEAARALDALEDMWWQHAYPVDGYDTSRHSGGLSANEYAEEVLKAAGRIIRVKPNKEWYRLTTPEERAALSASPPAAPAERDTRDEALLEVVADRIHAAACACLRRSRYCVVRRDWKHMASVALASCPVPEGGESNG